MELPLLSQPQEPSQIPPRPLRHHLALTVYWLSNSLMWGALLHMGLQSRLSDWFGQERVGYYLGIIGFVGGVFGLAGQIVAGAFSDRSLHPWGRRRPFLVAGATGVCLALLALGSARSFGPFLAAMGLLQLAANTALAPFTALLPDTVNPREHGKASGYMGIARLIGDVGGLILAGVMLSAGGLHNPTAEQVRELHDQRMLALCAGIAGFVLLTMLVTCLTIHEEPLAQRPNASPWQIASRAFAMDVKGNVDFFWLSVSRGITNFGFYVFLGILFLYVKHSLGEADAERASMLLLLPAIAAATAISAPAGILSDRIGRRKIIFVSQFLLAGSATIFLLASDMRTAFIAGVPAGLAYGTFTAVEWALACNLLPKAESARYLGLWNASAVVPQLLAFPFAGAVGSAISARSPGLGWRVDFGIAIVCCLLGAWFLRYVRERRG